MTLFLLTTPEKVATIALSGCSGALGEYVKLDDGRARIIADGFCFIVGRDDLSRWTVRFGAGYSINTDVEEAANLAFEFGRNCNVSKNFPISLK